MPPVPRERKSPTSCQRPEVVTQVGEVEQALRLGHGQVQAPQRVRAATRRGDGSRQAVLGDVVDHRADPPDPAGRGLELAEVGLPDPVAAGGWVMKDAPISARCLRPIEVPFLPPGPCIMFSSPAQPGPPPGTGPATPQPSSPSCGAASPPQQPSTHPTTPPAQHASAPQPATASARRLINQSSQPARRSDPAKRFDSVEAEGGCALPVVAKAGKYASLGTGIVNNCW